jgi:putative endonuclease
VTRDLGERGEALAERHLKRLGYRILERNYRCSLGEIDRIAVHGNTLVFLEVKARRTHDFGGPLEAVDRRKRRKLTRLAQYYVAQEGLHDTPQRFDVVGVWFSAAEPRVEVIANAFEAEE